MRTRTLSQSKAGDLLEDTFIITNAQLAAGSNGKHYIKGFLSDKSAQLTARIWNATPQQFSAFTLSPYVKIRGRVESYQNNLQVIIENFAPAEDGSYDLADLIPSTPKDIEVMTQRLFEILNSLTSPPTKAIVQAFLDDEALMTDFVRAPAASTFHHAYVGGLLEHTLSLIEVAEKLIPLYPGVSRDLTLAGLFLHDIAKTWELSYDAAFSYTSGGQLIGHVVKAALWIEDKARTAETKLGEPISRQLIDSLQHIVLSHHGLPEHGAAKTPMTPEALFVHLLDNLDAKMMMALSATRPPLFTLPPDGPLPVGGGWTETLKPFNARFYRPDPTLPPVLEAPTLHLDDAATPPPVDAPTLGNVSSRPAAKAPATGKKVPDQPLTERPLFSNPLFEVGGPKKK